MTTSSISAGRIKDVNGLFVRNDVGIPSPSVNSMAMLPPTAEAALKMTTIIRAFQAILVRLFAGIPCSLSYTVLPSAGGPDPSA